MARKDPEELSDGQKRRRAAMDKARAQTKPRVLRRRQIVAAGYVGSEAELDRLRKAGDFPLGIQLSPNAIGWTPEVLEEWLASRERVA